MYCSDLLQQISPIAVTRPDVFAKVSIRRVLLSIATGVIMARAQYRRSLMRGVTNPMSVLFQEFSVEPHLMVKTTKAELVYA